MKIAIIKGAGSYMANMVLQGVYGTMEAPEVVPAAQQANPDTGEVVVATPVLGRFTHAPEFNRVSHLFSYISNGGAPVDINSVDVIDVPDELANDFKANLMNELGQRWEGLYAQLTTGDTLTKALIQGESNQVRSGVRNHLASMGVQVYEVLVKAPSQTMYRSAEYTTADQLRRGMRPIPDASFEVTDVHAMGAECLGSKLPEPEQPHEPQAMAIDDANVEVARPWAFEGHYAESDATYKMHLVATSAEKAAAFANYILNDNSMREKYSSQRLTSAPVSVENVRQGAVVVYGDSDGDFDHEDDNSFHDRPVY